ncbi:MAG: FHA domain-containing protein, partial [Anaerolineae bacterium]
TVIVLHADGAVEVKKGLVGADFSVTVKTPTAQVTSAGTMFTVEVGESGETRVQTLQGQVQVQGNAGGSQTLSAGQQVAVSAGGALGEVSTFDVETTRQELSPAPEMPFDLSALDVQDEVAPATEPDVDLLGAGLVAALVFSCGLLILFLFVLRRRRKRKRARKAAPRPAASEWQQVYPGPQPVQRTMRGELVVCQGPSAGMRIPLGATVRLGRAADNDIVIGLPQVSSHHAFISATESGHVVADQGSANGTWVNDERIVQPCLLRSGDIIAVGGERFEYRSSG